MRLPRIISKNLGVMGATNITNLKGENYALVASVIDDRVKFAWSLLEKNGILYTDGSSRHPWGIYVSVRDFYKATHPLRQIKQDLQKGLSIPSC